LALRGIQHFEEIAYAVMGACMKKIILFLFLFSFAFAQYYDIALVRANDSVVVSSLVYDDNSTSYKDNSIENPDVNLRICAASSSDLLNKYVALCYADGYDGDFIEVVHFPVRITSVQPSGCAYVPLEISSFKAWYPSIPYVFISNSVNMSSASRWKLSRLTGWFSGNYSINRTQTGNEVNITVVNATDDNGNAIVPDVDYLVIGLVRPNLTTMDTAISSINNTVTLYSDSPSASYNVFINGIGPDVPPYVKIITPENGKEYSVNTIPFTYIMIDDDGITSCWYVLDGATTVMPHCGPAYILSNLRDGLHTLVLYANDTTGNVVSDSVQFRVKTITPQPGGGGGGTGIPFYQPPIVPPPPPYVELTIIPQDIFVTINYARDGEADFKVTSNTPLSELSCFVRSDFENYTIVTLDKNSIGANETINGKIIVKMRPQEILTYDKSREGVLQCVGNASANLLSSTLANVYLFINKPIVQLQENATVAIYQGEELNYTFVVLNRNNMTELQNLSFEFTKYQFLFANQKITSAIAPGEIGELSFTLKVPNDIEPGKYVVPINFYEHGLPVGSEILVVDVLKREVPIIPVCHYPDLSWTILILILGVICAIIVFYLKRKKEQTRSEKTMKNGFSDKIGTWLEENKESLAYSLITISLFVLIWIIVVLSLWKCT